MPDATDLDRLKAEIRDVWEENAAFWDDHMGDVGNAFHRELVAPAAERLLAVRPGETVLEIACGVGLFARRLAELGAQVVATDLSAAFLERARARTAAYANQITFRQLDATAEAQLRALGEGRFDAAVSNMALMDMAEVEPLFASLPRLLRPGGRFVFTQTHPCFNTTDAVRTVEQVDTGEDIAVIHSLKLTKYRGMTPRRGIGVRGQPRPHVYFDRTLSDLLAPAFRAGLVLDALEEPAFAPPSEDDPTLSLRRFSEFPMVLAARLRPISIPI